MDWLSDFESQSTREKKTAVMNVICVMMADGKVDPREFGFLKLVLNRVGMSEGEKRELLAHPEKIKFTVPQSEPERRMQLVDMVFMMMVDGNIDPREIKEVLKFAKLLGFSPQTVADLTKKIIIEGIEKGRSRSQVNSDVEAWLKT